MNTSTRNSVALASIPPTSAAIRTSSAAASGSASASPARSRSSRNSWSATRRWPRSTSRSRRRSSICSWICAPSSISPTCSSATTSAWSSISPTASPSCISGASSRRRRRGGDLRPPEPSLHAGAACRGAAHRGAKARVHRHHGRNPKPAEPAIRLPFPPALPARHEDLPRGGAGAADCRPGASQRLPPERPAGRLEQYGFRWNYRAIKLLA